ncbi:hypothetical protein Tco_0114649 [Tanacetum coccineum]
MKQRKEADSPQDESEHEDNVPTPSNDHYPVGKSDDEGMLFDIDVDLHGEEVIVDEAQRVIEEVVEDITTARNKEVVSTATQVTTATITSIELTMAQTLVEIKCAAKPKAKSITMQEPSEATTTTTIPAQSFSKDKGKAILAQLEKERNEARKIAEWDNVHATIDVDRQMAE